MLQGEGVATSSVVCADTERVQRQRQRQRECRDRDRDRDRESEETETETDRVQRQREGGLQAIPKEYSKAETERGYRESSERERERERETETETERERGYRERLPVITKKSSNSHFCNRMSSC